MTLLYAVGDDWDVDLLDASEFTLDPDAAHLPDLSDRIPTKPPEQVQDVFEGLGAPGDNTVTPRQACLAIVHDIRTGAGYPPGYCLQYQRIKRGVGPKYEDAKSSGAACDHPHRITDWSKVPRGVIVYLIDPSDPDSHGHIVTCLGGGYIGTTDWPTGEIGRVKGAALQSAWGYPVAFWANEVNDVVVWRPDKPTPVKPTPQTPRINRAIRTLGDVQVDRRKAGSHHDVDVLGRAIRLLSSIAIEN